jgi:hypothetical protein
MQTFGHVDPLLARATMDIAAALNPQGWIEVPAAQEPNTLEAVIDHFKRTGKIAVTRKADFVSARKRLWASPDVWQAFFVWHDWAHVHADRGTFDPEGERRVHALQRDHLYSWANRLPVRPSSDALRRAEHVLEAHNLGRLDDWLVHNNPADNLRDFANGYLAAKGSIIQPTFFDFPDQYPQDVRDWIANFMRDFV